MSTSQLGLFDAYGIEIELMIVNNQTLDIMPAADSLLTAAAGHLVSDFEDGPITWSNELVSHVIELKTTGPTPSLDGLEARFYKSQQHAQQLLKPLNAMLMPSGMHPWMNPLTETTLWPHDNNEIYSLYNDIFDCRGHGWSNLQSVHINLPFSNELEFRKLHSAIRLILPLIPSLGASSPFAEGKLTSYLDSRLSFYETNQARLPIIAGGIIPENIDGFDDYRQKISNPIREAVSPFDKLGLLEGDWLNSRGAIARIDRGSIEIRLLDTQECAHADITIVQFIVELVRSIVDQPTLLEAADKLPTRGLYNIYRSCVASAEAAVITDSAYLQLLGIHEPAVTANQILKTTLGSLVRPSLRTTGRRAKDQSEDRIKLEKDFEQLVLRPSLASRIKSACGLNPSRENLRDVYRILCQCLEKNLIFDPAVNLGLPLVEKTT